MLTLRTLGPAAAALLLLAGQAMAGVTYSFTAAAPDFGSAQYKSFSLTTADILDQDTTFGADSLLACNAPGGHCLGVQFYADARAAHLTNRDGLSAFTLQFQVGRGIAWLNYYFDQDALAHGGSSAFDFNRAHVYVSGQPLVRPALVPIPEPSSLGCLAGGIAVLGALRRRRRA